ncbi:dnaJ homolog subfamily C member 12 isoform X2 [Pseudoliparis swirei]|uniref:dnaJ homolog subfamily C member 12 isoform X2 n=1 Tax=Pseudoliparis swirei TaxID=2059687 RepID=UPI0024BEEB4A|nr:dnaJ homolog subfamily C member 12 isoform X2 [Pseudoliparis swirei]
METILNCNPEDLEDFYGLLGCDELSSTEQILNEYKIRALACHPDRHPDDPGAVANFQNLQKAKEVLCNETKRKNYDLWTRSGVTISFHDWQSLNDSVKTVTTTDIGVSVGPLTPRPACCRSSEIMRFKHINV